MRGFLVGVSLAALLPAVAAAQVAGSVTTDLNLREGPGSNYAVIDTIPSGSAVTINGCVTGANWCEVAYGNTVGYSFADYLTTTAAGTTVTVVEDRSLVPSIAADTVSAVGEATGAVTGALIGGTVGAITGGVDGLREGAREGAATGANIADDDVVYVQRNPRDPVYLDGEVGVGVGVPAEVSLYEVPNSQYRYVNVNGTPVLVEPSSRQIVYVVR